jgi:hypothetical protein
MNIKSIVSGLVIVMVLISGAYLFGDIREKSNDGKRFEDIRQIKNALELYSADNNGLYPSGTDLDLLVTGDYIPDFPIDPINSDSYVYSYQGTSYSGISCDSGLCASYILKVVLEQLNQEALDIDMDGTIAEVKCDDPAFCMTP